MPQRLAASQEDCVLGEGHLERLEPAQQLHSLGECPDLRALALDRDLYLLILHVGRDVRLEPAYA